MTKVKLLTRRKLELKKNFKKICLLAFTLAAMWTFAIGISAEVSETDVVKIGDTGYATLEAAVAAVKSGTPTTIEVLKDVTVTEGMKIENKTITVKSADPENIKTVTVQGDTNEALDKNWIMLLGNTKFTLENVKFTRANAKNSGSDVVPNYALFVIYGNANLTMNDGSIISDVKGGNGGAIFMSSAAKANIVIDGGTIENCTSKWRSAVAVDEGAVELKKGAIKTDLSILKTVNTVVYEDFEFTGIFYPWQNTAVLNLTVKGNGAFAKAVNYAMAGSGVTNIILEKDEVVNTTDNGVKEREAGKGFYWIQVQNKKIVVEGNGKKITLNGNINIGEYSNASVTLKNVTLTRNLSGQGTYALIDLNNASVILENGAQLGEEGKTLSGGNGGGIWVSGASSSVTMKAGSKIINMKSQWGSGAISFAGGGTFTMEGGEISGCNINGTSFCGSAIGVRGATTININGGKIVNNTNTGSAKAFIGLESNFTGTLNISSEVDFGAVSGVAIYAKKLGSVSVPAAIKGNVAVASGVTVSDKNTVTASDGSFGYVSNDKLYWISPADFSIESDLGKYKDNETEMHVVRALTKKVTEGDMPVTTFGTVFVKSDGTIESVPTNGAWKNEEGATFAKDKGFIVDLVGNAEASGNIGTVYVVSFFKVNGIGDIVTLNKAVDYDFTADSVKTISAKEIAGN